VIAFKKVPQKVKAKKFRKIFPIFLVSEKAKKEIFLEVSSVSKKHGE
jgi:hypothetical protein